MRRVRLEPAYVLSARPYRETSTLLEAFTAAQGRIGLVARGVRGPKSRWRGLLQPFQRLLLTWTEGGELGTLSGAEADGPPAALAGENVFAGWYLNELLLRLLARRDPHPALFDRYAAALADLTTADTAAGLRRFELHLLAELGYGLHLPAELEPEAWYHYEPDAGVRLAEPGPASYRGDSLIALGEARFDTPERLHDAQRLLRAALEPHLGGRRLRSGELLRSLRSVTRGARAP